MIFRPLLFIAFSLFGLLACSTSSEPTKHKTDTITQTQAVKATPAASPATEFSQIVATIGNESIDLNELDNAIQIALFDLEWRKYQLRKDMLGRMLTQRQALAKGKSAQSLGAEILLNPPQAPRIILPRDKRPTKGALDAPILLSVFCSYQSSHCARLQAIIKKIEAYYPESVAFNFYDLPQSFHRYGIPAANAFHCAQAAGEPWAYQSALYSDISKLDKPRFMNIAEQLGLELNDFASCLDENRYLPNIKADIELASRHGLSSVPVVFINGLYAKGPQNFNAYQYYLNQELAHLGLKPAPLKQRHLKQQLATESQLAISLLATTVSSDANNSTAMLKLPENEQGLIYKKGSHVLEQVQIVKIEDQRILIDNQGRLEFIRLQTSRGHDLKTTANKLSAQASLELMDSADSYDEENPPSDVKQRELPATGEMALSKEWLDNQLINQTQLEQHFYNAEHVVEGHHLVKLDEITDQRFYNTLGFKTGDVLLRVNDQWVHEGQNPLWDSLAKSEAVTVVLMRGGYPVRYDYNIK